MQQVTEFKTSDGLLFESAYAAEAHEKRTMVDRRIAAFVNGYFADEPKKLEMCKMIKAFLLAHPTPDTSINGSPELALVNKFRATVLEKLNLKTGWGRNELKDILADTYTIVMGESPGTAEDDPIV